MLRQTTKKYFNNITRKLNSKYLTNEVRFHYLYETKKNCDQKENTFTVHNSDLQKKLNTIIEHHRKQEK